MKVLYDDNHVVVVFKPAGVEVQGELTEQVREWIRQKYNKPGNVFVGLVHRLDRSVAGVMVFARTSKGAARLTEQIRERSVEKTYRAWVEGAVAHDGTLTHWLAENDGYVTAYDHPVGAGKEARLHYTILRREPVRTLLEIDLETGRKHQIRVQLARIGHPIVGDKRYGARTPWPAGIALVAARLRFKHPTQEREVVAEIPPELDPLGGLQSGQR